MRRMVRVVTCGCVYLCMSMYVQKGSRFISRNRTSGLIIPSQIFFAKTSKARSSSHPLKVLTLQLHIGPPLAFTLECWVPDQRQVRWRFHCTTQDCRDGLLTEILPLLVIKLYAGSVIAVGEAIKIQFKICGSCPPEFIIQWERQAQTFLASHSHF